MDWHFVAAGLIVGVLVGLTGIGGSSLLAPLLILLLGVKPIVAVGTDLAYSVPTKLLAAYLHGKQATIDRAWVKMLLIGGVPGVLAGVALLAVLRAHADLAHSSLDWGRDSAGLRGDGFRRAAGLARSGRHGVGARRGW